MQQDRHNTQLNIFFRIALAQLDNPYIEIHGRPAPLATDKSEAFTNDVSRWKHYGLQQTSKEHIMCCAEFHCHSACKIMPFPGLDLGYSTTLATCNRALPRQPAMKKTLYLHLVSFLSGSPRQDQGRGREKSTTSHSRLMVVKEEERPSLAFPPSPERPLLPPVVPPWSPALSLLAECASCRNEVVLPRLPNRSLPNGQPLSGMLPCDRAPRWRPSLPSASLHPLVFKDPSRKKFPAGQCQLSVNSMEVAYC